MIDKHTTGKQIVSQMSKFFKSPKVCCGAVQLIICGALLWCWLQCSAVNWKALQCIAVQCGEVKWIAVQCSAVQCREVTCSAVQCDKVLCGKVHHSVQSRAVHCKGKVGRNLHKIGIIEQLQYLYVFYQFILSIDQISCTSGLFYRWATNHPG